MAVDVDLLRTELDERLTDADAALARDFPGDPGGRQPVHTVYVPADRFSAELPHRWGAQAQAALDEKTPLLRDALLTAGTATAADVDDLLDRVRAKLAAEPIEDVRIDFEDGYGARTPGVEDGHVQAAAQALATSLRAGNAPPFTGIRIKSFEAPTRERALRTLVGFLSTLAAADVALDAFVTTLPKVTSIDQVSAMVLTCDQVEAGLGLAANSLRFEIQVETPQSILGPDGTALVARMIHASAGRCTALHYGTYDYSAFCGIAAQFQSMAHPVADHAKSVMQAAAAGTGVRLSDGSTNILPVGDDDAVREGWELHLRLVRRSLERGYYQGWDLHPAQLPTRYAATFAFYRSGLDRAAQRLRNYLEHTASAVLDEPATARALADFLLRAVQCGAVTPAELEASAGIDVPTCAELARPGR